MIRFYTAPTGNCHRVSILLEEIGVPYEVVPMDFARGDFQSPDFLAINPVGQVPAISDDDGPGGKTLRLAESSAILAYLARKAGRFLPQGETEQIAAEYWVALIGGLQGALTTIFFARRLDATSHAGIIDNLLADTNRYLRAIEARLQSSAYMAGERYTYVDMLMFSLAHRTLGVNGVTLDAYPAIEAWRAGIAARPAVQCGIAVPA